MLKSTFNASVLRSEIALAKSVFVTLWIRRDVLVTDSLDVVLAEAVVQHGRTLQGLHRDDARAEALLQMIPGAQGARRSGRSDEGAELEARAPRLLGKEHPFHGEAGHLEMRQVVAELAELVDHDVGRILLQGGALLVDLADVALRSRRADDVRGVGHPVSKPAEALFAHAFGKDSDAAASEDARDRDPTAAVVAGGRPDGAMCPRIELARHDPRHQAGIGGQHLVRRDHGEPIPQGHQDGGRHAGELLPEGQVGGGVHPAASIPAVLPVHPEQVQRVGLVGTDRGQGLADARRNPLRLRELSEGRELDGSGAEVLDAARVDGLVHDLRLQPQTSHGRCTRHG